MPVTSLLVSDLEAVDSCGADRVAAAFVFVVRGDVADGFVAVFLWGSAADERH